MIEEARLENEGEIEALIVESGEICSSFLYVNPEFEDEEEDEDIFEEAQSNFPNDRRVSFIDQAEVHNYEQLTSEVEEESSSSSLNDDMPEIQAISTPESSDNEEAIAPNSELTTITNSSSTSFMSEAKRMQYSSAKCISSNATEIHSQSVVSIKSFEDDEVANAQMLVGFSEETSLEVFTESTVKMSSTIKKDNYSSSGYYMGSKNRSSSGGQALEEVEVPLDEEELARIAAEQDKSYTSQAYHSKVRTVEESKQEFEEIVYKVTEDELKDRDWTDPTIECPISLKTTLVLPVGEVLELVASIDGNPFPKLTWTFNDHVINRQFMPHIDISNRGKDIALLTIDGCEVEDSGVYCLIAENEVSKAVQKYTVEILDMGQGDEENTYEYEA